MQFKFMTKLLNLRTTTGVISSFKQNTLNKEGKKKLKKRGKKKKMKRCAFITCQPTCNGRVGCFYVCGGEMNGASLPGGGEVMRRDGISFVERIQQRSG